MIMVLGPTKKKADAMAEAQAGKDEAKASRRAASYDDDSADAAPAAEAVEELEAQLDLGENVAEENVAESVVDTPADEA